MAELSLVQRAKLAELTEQYGEMAAAMKFIVLTETRELSPEERRMFSVAFERVIGCFRYVRHVIVVVVIVSVTKFCLTLDRRGRS